MNRKKSTWNFLLVTLFLTGAAVLVLELIGARLLSPIFGVSLYVWSSLITITLITLSLGYWWGGRLADKAASPSSLYFLILLSGLLALPIPLVAPFILPLFIPLGLKIGALVSATVLFGAPLFLLGMVSPYAAKLYATELEMLGRRVGHLYAISTLGSCFGSLITGFVLIPTLGVNNILYLVSALLIGLWSVQMVLQRSKKAGLGLALFLLPIGLLFVSPQASKAQLGGTVVHNAYSIYGHIRVEDLRDTRWLLIDGVPNTAVTKATGESLSGYADFFEFLPVINPNAKKVLLIGLGGGVMANRFKAAGLTVDSIEIDPEVARAAQDYFGVTNDNGQIFIQDARQYIQKTTKRYDFLILDVYSGESAPYHMFTKEAVEEMRSLLNENGILGVNYLGYAVGEKSRAARSVYHTLHAVFPHVDLYTVEHRTALGNIIFFASDKPTTVTHQGRTPGQLRMLDQQVKSWGLGKPLTHVGDALVFSDDYNPIETWSLTASAEWRNTIWNNFWN